MLLCVCKVTSLQVPLLDHLYLSERAERDHYRSFVILAYIYMLIIFSESRFTEKPIVKYPPVQNSQLAVGEYLQIAIIWRYGIFLFILTAKKLFRNLQKRMSKVKRILYL